MSEREIGGIPLLYGFPTLPGEVAVWCRFCVYWHHHQLTAPTASVAHYEAHCYARPDWHSRGYWIEPTATPMAKVRRQARYVRPWEARLLASGQTTEAIRRKQLHPEPQPRPPKPPPRPPKPRPSPIPPWPRAYPQFPEEE